jgi:hypothetical protein
MKFTDADYEAVVDKARQELFDRDGSFDNVGDKVEELLMYTPGLGPYMRKKLKTFDCGMRLASDIHNGIQKLRV